MPTATSPLGCQKPLPHASSQLTVTCDHSVLWTWKSNFVNLHNFLHSQPGCKSSSVLPADWPTAAAHISRETWRMLLLPLAVEIWSEKVGCLVWGATAATSWSGPSSKVSGMLSPQVCRVDLWGCDNKFGDLDHRLTTVLDLKLSQIQTYQTFNLIRCTGATSRQLFIISARKCLSQSMDHHWCFPMKSLSVCLKLSGVETHGFPLHQAVEIVSQVGPKHVIMPVEAFWCL